MNAYTPARAVMVVHDNGEERMVELPEIQELLDEISNLKCRIFEICRDGDAELEARGAEFRKIVRWAAAGWLLFAIALATFLVKRLSL